MFKLVLSQICNWIDSLPVNLRRILLFLFHIMYLFSSSLRCFPRVVIEYRSEGQVYYEPYGSSPCISSPGQLWGGGGIGELGRSASV